MPTTSMTPLPPAPTRLDPANFSARGDALMTALPQFVTEANALQADVTQKQQAAATAAQNASTSADAASASAASAAAIVGATKWNAATNYSQGNVVWSLVNGLAYRAKVAGVDATDPANSPSRWYPLSVLPDMTGKAGRTLKTLDGLTATWAATYASVGELVDFPMPPNGTAPNSITTPTGEVFLKSGVLATREAAVAAGYDVTTLESYGMCTAKSGTIPAGGGGAYQMDFGVGTSGGMFVRVGAGGVIQYSSDGLNFTAATSGTTSDIQVVRFLNNQFVALSATWIGVSPDGINWSPRGNPNTYGKVCIDFINGVYVVTSVTTDAPKWSPDLITWTPISNANFGNPTPNIAFGNGVFVFSDGYSICTLPADGSGAMKRVYVDPDGLSNHSYHFLYAGGRFMALSRTSSTGLTSVDGVSWTGFTTPAAVVTQYNQGQSAIGYINSRFVANFQGVGAYYTTTNGASWVAVTTVGGSWNNGHSCFKPAGDKLFAFGGPATDVAGLFYSTDGITFTWATGITGYVNDIDYGASVYIAVTDSAGGTAGNAWSSGNGTAFTSVYSTSNGINCVAYGAGGFVIGLNTGAPNLMFSTSGNSGTWATPASAPNINPAMTIKYLNGSYVVGSSSSEIAFASTPNGTWTKVTLAGTSTPSPTYANNRYTVFGPNSYADATSLGSLWANQYVTASSYAIGSWAHLASDGTRMLMMGNTYGVIFSSGDGKVWANYSQYSDTTSTLSIRYVKDRFIITYVNGLTPKYSVGNTWAAVAPMANMYGEVAWGGGQWLLHTQTGGVSKSWTSPDFTNWTPHYGVNAVPYGIRLAYGNGVFVGTTGAGSFVTPDGATGMIGCPLSITAPTNSTSYIKVK